MCGILGILPAVEQGFFSKALHLIKHRGPDGTGIWDDGDNIILGHQRLSILDTSLKASQPMHFHSRYHIVFNGEIYNFIEIKRELQGSGLVFKNDSDTEVILGAYVAWGSECIHKFNGMWALAIWDDVEKCLFLSRDPVGEKPLFYFCDNNRFGFASEQKALLPFLNDVEVSSEFYVMSANTYNYESTDLSLFKGLKRFPAGHNGFYRNGRLNTERYWDPSQTSVEIPKKYQDQVINLQELLLDSCKLRLRSDVPVATGLSGGIDSGAIAAYVGNAGSQVSKERQSKNWQNAFVASFPNTVMDETAEASEVARHLDIGLINVKTNPAEMSKSLENLAFMFEEIHEVNPLPHINLYSVMRKNGIFVSLDGHGGDELFCGYESSILHALLAAFPNVNDMSNVLQTYYDIHPQNNQFRAMQIHRIIAHLAAAKIRQGMRLRNDPVLLNAAKHHNGLEKHLMDLTYKSVLPTLLRNYDRYSMINGVEVRSPFLDPRILKFASSLPWKSKIRNGYSKSILRDAIAPLLPKTIVRKKTKIGFAPPISNWIKGPLKEYLLDEISSTNFINASLISSKKLSKEILSVAESDKDLNLYKTEQIWKNFNIYLWEKAFLIDKRWVV